VLIESWNSRAEPTFDDLPFAVELTLQLEEKDAEGVYQTGRALTRVVGLPLRPIGESDEDDACGGALTVAACIEVYAQYPELVTLRAQFDSLTEEFGSACANDPNIVERIAALSPQLVQAGGPDPNGTCY